MKNFKIVTKLYLGFLVMDIYVILSQAIGYLNAKKIVGVDNPEKFLSSYGWFTLFLFLMAIVASSVISVYLIRSIRISLKQLMNATEEMKKGKVDVELEKIHDDEIGALIDSFREMIEGTRYQAKIAAQVAEGNLAVEVTPRSEEDVIGLALQKMVMQNRHSMGQIKDAAYQVTTSSSQVAIASEALAQGSTEQASAIEQITASITDVAEKTKQNASQANAAAALVTGAIEDVKKGNEEMKEMVVAMQDINQSSESISKIIKVIDDIAFQTNILALNAAVEAARAGEAGKGFAVVAEEVRNLAAKSSSAATETAEMIEDSIRKVEKGSRIAYETEQALGEITKVVQQSENMIMEIAEASNYQATAIAQIDQAIEQVSQVVQTNSATSEECAAASQELASQAGRVREMVSVYQLDGDNYGAGTSVAAVEQHAYDNSADRNEQIISLKGNFGKY